MKIIILVFIFLLLSIQISFSQNSFLTALDYYIDWKNEIYTTNSAQVSYIRQISTKWNTQKLPFLDFFRLIEINSENFIECKMHSPLDYLLKSMKNLTKKLVT